MYIMRLQYLFTKVCGVSVTLNTNDNQFQLKGDLGVKNSGTGKQSELPELLFKIIKLENSENKELVTLQNRLGHLIEVGDTDALRLSEKEFLTEVPSKLSRANSFRSVFEKNKNGHLIYNHIKKIGLTEAKGEEKPLVKLVDIAKENEHLFLVVKLAEDTPKYAGELIPANVKDKKRSGTASEESNSSNEDGRKEDSNNEDGKKEDSNNEDDREEGSNNEDDREEDSEKNESGYDSMSEEDKKSSDKEISRNKDSEKKPKSKNDSEKDHDRNGDNAFKKENPTRRNKRKGTREKEKLSEEDNDNAKKKQTSSLKRSKNHKIGSLRANLTGSHKSFGKTRENHPNTKKLKDISDREVEELIKRILKEREMIRKR